jgi:pyruvate,water dikinase
MRGTLIKLGSGQAAAAGVGPKAALLDHARRAGLPAPRGYVITDGQGEFADLPLSGPLAVRSAFSAEDGVGESLAGWFLSLLWVEPEDVGAAVEQVRDSAARRKGSFRRDVLVMEMVDARTAGVAFLERDFEDDLVNWTAGTADGLVSGEVRGERLLLPKLLTGERANGTGFEPRLQRLLRGVRRVFGDGNWDVEWADDGAVCWLVQVRRITRSVRRDEAFTLANHKEILPELPSRLMTSVIASAAPELFAWYRRFDPTLPERRLFIEVFEGRPLINVSLLSDMMRHWGLPTSLVTGNIGGSTDRPAPIRLSRMLRKLPVLLKLGFAQLRAAGEAKRAAEEIRRATAGPAVSFEAALNELRFAYARLVTGMFALTSAMSGPLALLRRLGVIEELHAGLRTETSRLCEMLGSLEDIDAFVEEHGHRGVYESDIARPRYRETPEALVSYRAATRNESRPRRRLSLKARLAWPVWAQAARAIRAREWYRSEAMRGFGNVRAKLLLLCDRAGVSPETLWLLDAQEAAELDRGWRPTAEFVRARQAEMSRLGECRLPDLVRRFDDPDEFYRTEEAPRPGSLAGVSLTSGTVSGRALVLQEPCPSLPEGYEPGATILVARSVDAGWIPLFLQCAGVVVETGGDLSHGSILLREIGLPAITNVEQATRSIRTGDWLRLKATAGRVEIGTDSATQGRAGTASPAFRPV